MYADRPPQGMPGPSRRSRFTARHYRVVYAATRKSEAELREALSRYGAIRWIGAHIVDDQEVNHFFVEMDAQDKAEAACAELAHGHRIHLLPRCPDLVEVFDALAPPLQTPVKRSRVRTRRNYPSAAASTSHAPLVPAKREYDEIDGSSGPSTTSLACLLPTPPPSIDGLYAHGLGGSLSTGGADIKSEPPPDSVAPPSPPSPPSPRTLAGFTPYKSPFAHTTVTPGGASSGILAYGGSQLIRCLDELTDDPSMVIAMLTQTYGRALDHDKWIIVAGRYRSKGNIEAAVAVLSAMIGIMTSVAVGLSKEDLKPAFLMLASCYTDLSRRSRRADGGGRDLAANYVAKAQEYFQVVYGTNVPPEGTSRSIHASPSATLPAVNPVSLQPPHGRSEPRRIAEEDVAIITTMKREIQSLRDRQTNISQQLSSAEASYHTLVGNFEAEKSQRQKVEQDMAITMEELTVAQRSAKWAHDQCKCEVDTRRRLEVQVAELEKELGALKDDASARISMAQDKERNARECLSRLGNQLVRAAQCGFEDPLNPLHGMSQHLDEPPPKRQRTTSVSSSSRYAAAAGPSSGVY